MCSFILFCNQRISKRNVRASNPQTIKKPICHTWFEKIGLIGVLYFTFYIILSYLRLKHALCGPYSRNTSRTNLCLNCHKTFLHKLSVQPDIYIIMDLFTNLLCSCFRSKAKCASSERVCVWD